MRRAAALVILLLLAACRGSAPVTGGEVMNPADVLRGLQQTQTWEVAQLTGVSALPAGERPSLQFLDGNRVAGSTGCNRLNGPFELAGGGLTFGALATTRRACVGAGMEVESTFLRALQSTRSHSLEAGTLSLLGANGEMLARLVPAS
jgi:heat shock protein HslJ